MLKERTSQVTSLHAMEMQQALTLWTQHLSLEMTSALVTELWDEFHDFREMARKTDYLHLFSALLALMTRHDVSELAKSVKNICDDEVDAKLHFIKYSTQLLHDIAGDVIDNFSLLADELNNFTSELCTALSKNWLELDNARLEKFADVFTSFSGGTELNSAVKLVLCLDSRSMQHEQLLLHVVRVLINETRGDASLLPAKVNLNELLGFLCVYQKQQAEVLHRIRDDVGVAHFDGFLPRVFVDLQNKLKSAEADSAFFQLKGSTRNYYRRHMKILVMHCLLSINHYSLLQMRICISWEGTTTHKLQPALLQNVNKFYER